MRMPFRVAVVAGAVLLSVPVPAQSLADVFKRVKDSVVTIHVEGTGAATEPERQGQDAVEATGGDGDGGVGSGVLTDVDGLVLTAAHVVQTASKIEVQFASGETVPARVLSSEPLADVALLKLERQPKNAVTAHLGDSDSVETGDEVFVVGAPFGISHSLSVGHVGGRRSANVLFGGLMAAELIQTDAAINTGNSGGPMFNRNGEVVGIVSSILSRSGGFEGIGFAVSSNTARRLSTERPPWTGLDGFLVTGPLAEILNLPQAAGLLVQRVARNSPAERMGLRAGSYAAVINGEDLLVGGDIILAVDGIRLSEPDASAKIRLKVKERSKGALVQVTVLRGGRLIELEHRIP